MRLLHFDAATKLVLTDFSGKSIPPYAILSHRWAEGEVLFADVKNKSYGSKAGYRKVQFCAEQATLDGLQYFWVDTCCIDKYNRSELSKAINSMYSWYRDAAKCYVFLQDVSAPTLADAQQLHQWRDPSQPNEWFTRGWTLQELIAPKSVEFFSREGHRLGDKTSLKGSICEITGIPAEALQCCPLESFSRDERMRWAKHRTTTEPEDEVYCLLGILGIHMPTSYGEGKERALERLKNESRSTGPARLSIPFARNPRFVGRELQLAKLESKLFQDQQTTLIAVTGVGGTGKSQLALELAYLTKDKYADCSIFWIDASGEDSLNQAYANIAQKLDIPGWDREGANIRLLVKHRLSESAHRWLLIFDNIDDTAVVSTGSFMSSSAILMDYLPQSEKGSILFTTTIDEIADTLAGQDVIQLEKLMPDTAEAMLNNHLFNAVPTDERQEMKLLLDQLSYLPLAIVRAAACIRSTAISLKEYRSQVTKLQKHTGSDPVTTTLLISLDRIQQESTLAAEYLFLTACIERRDIPVEFLGTAPPHEKNRAIRILDNYALVTRRPADSALEFHRLTHLGIRNWLLERQRLQEWTERAISHLLTIFPDNEYGNRSRWQRFLPHAKYVLSQTLTHQDDTARTDLAWKCATALDSDGRWKEAERLLVQVIEKKTRVPGEEHPDTLTSIESLASIYMKQERWQEAENLLVQVLKTRKQVLKDGHPDTLVSMSNLSSTYLHQGRLDEAEELELQMLETMKRRLEQEHLDSPTTGQLKEIEELVAQATQLRRRVLKDELDPNTLARMSKLEWTHRIQGQLKEAEELEIQVIEKTKRAIGEEHADTLRSMNNLALTYGSQGQWKEEDKLLVRVLETRKQVLGDEHPDTLASMDNLVSAYRNQGRWKETEELELQVIQTRNRALRDERTDTLADVSNLASTYRKQGRWKEAEELLVQVVDTRKRVLGDEHTDTLTDMGNLASTYRKQGRWKEAEALLAQVVDTRKRVLGDEHIDTLVSLVELILTYTDQRRWKEVEELVVQVVKIGKQVLGEEHLDTLNGLANLAITLPEISRPHAA